MRLFSCKDGYLIPMWGPNTYIMWMICSCLTATFDLCRVQSFTACYCCCARAQRFIKILRNKIISKHRIINTIATITVTQQSNYTSRRSARELRRTHRLLITCPRGQLLVHSLATNQNRALSCCIEIWAAHAHSCNHYESTCGRKNPPQFTQVHWKRKVFTIINLSPDIVQHMNTTNDRNWLASFPGLTFSCCCHCSSINKT